MSFLHEIRKQSYGVRQAMFALCLVTTLSLVGMVWFRSFQKNLFVLLNPDQESQEQFFAQQGNTDQTSLFGYIGGAIKDATANIFNLIRGKKSGNEVIIENQPSGQNIPNPPAHSLPLPENK